MVKIVDSLQQIGLTEKEALVYNASLDLGKATVEKIAEQAGIVRTTTYTQIESLMKQGLMSSFVQGKKTFYTAEAPTNLKRLLEKQKNAVIFGESLLEQILPDLLAVHGKTGTRPVIRFFPGKEGLITMRNEVLTMKEKNLSVITAYSDFIKIFSKDEATAFTTKRKAKKINIRVLFTKENDAYSADSQMSDAEARELPYKDFPLNFDIYIFDNKICISSLKDEIWGVMIDSHVIKESMQSLFNIVWKVAPMLKSMT